MLMFTSYVICMMWILDFWKLGAEDIVHVFADTIL